ncbi:PGN_0703 family putative restriction endonuclease [Azohydromonas lata]|uniref:PGN_0703 family putative restriction endonuclease n=1 Tax=Azohydromonas lata TaxID=45677 RepID=UPI0012F4FACB|nr:hypothetical protein [Azohydromonas lata]
MQHPTNSKKRALQWPLLKQKKFSEMLRLAAADWFKSKHLPTHARMPYCLGEWEQWPSNLILPEVADYIQKQREAAAEKKSPFPLHKYLHHGMSSQAMAFNLIGPLITRRDYSPLISLLESKNVEGASEIAEAVFEYKDRKVFNEDAGQPTSIDIALKDKNGQPFIFIESKFDERAFGGCSVFGLGDCSGASPIGFEDDCFLHFIGRKYWPLMSKHGITDQLKNERQCIFAMHYQFFREILFSIEKNGTFVLLSDERSPVFSSRAGEDRRSLMPFLTSFLPEKLKSRVVAISTQELVREIEHNPRHEDWIPEFKKKYAMNAL